ncbi:MAG TPA: HAD family phosphatase [Thermoleophilaceae bacterium]|nr:HAD family phosphatase [Thermoleophilaceae bacterium]
MRRTFISDFGGVLTSPLSEGFLAYQEESNVSLEELGRAMARATETHGEHPLFALERGEISERAFAERLERELPDGFSLRRLREVYFERLVPNERMIAFARALRERGLRTALLTNNVREWEPLWRAKLPEIDEIFEVVVDSAFVGMRKPDPRIYELTLERLGSSADECVFLDDLEVNCDAARELGMIAVRFEDTDRAIEAVEAAVGG